MTKVDFSASASFSADNFWAVRHGYGDHNYYKDIHGAQPRVTDPELHELGLRQSTDSGRRARELGLDIRYVISSPMKRVMQTAEAFLKSYGYHGSPVIVDALATEMMEPGELIDDGTPKDQLEPEYALRPGGLCFDFSGVAPGQWWPNSPETKDQLEKRVQEFLRRYFTEMKLPPHQTIVFSHGLWIERLTSTVNFPNGGLGNVNRDTRKVELIYTPEQSALRKRTRPFGPAPTNP